MNHKTKLKFYADGNKTTFLQSLAFYICFILKNMSFGFEHTESTRLNIVLDTYGNSIPTHIQGHQSLYYWFSNCSPHFIHHTSNKSSINTT